MHECVLTLVGRDKEKFLLVPEQSDLEPLYCMFYLFVLVHGRFALFFFPRFFCILFWSCLTGAVCCVFGLCQSVAVIQGTAHLFSCPPNVPSQRSARLRPQARTPAFSNLQMSRSFSDLQFFFSSPLLLLLLLLLCVDLHFLLPSFFFQKSQSFFGILCFKVAFEGFTFCKHLLFSFESFEISLAVFQ